MNASQEQALVFSLIAFTAALLLIAVIKPHTYDGEAGRARYDAEPVGASPIDADEGMGYW